LGEIEAAIHKHPDIVKALVDYRDVGSQKALVAYVVAKSKTHASVSASLEDDVPRFLGEIVPDHLVPHHVLIVDEIPLSSNGKLDRSRLPNPVPIIDGKPLSTPTEQELARIWIELLGCEAIGPTDRFIELGGNSILAVRLATKIHQVFGVRLPTSQIALLHSRRGTVEALARFIDQQTGSH
jgi:acyl carrier protein